VSVDPRTAPLIAALATVGDRDSHERADCDATLEFLGRVERPFDEHAQPEHVTASAYVVSALGVILVHHLLLSIWVQPGGHVEPGEPPELASVREVQEETGVTARHLDPPKFLEVDLHDGPRGHLHYDCRWLLEASATDLAPQEGESEALGWFLPTEALERCVPTLRAGLVHAFATARTLELPAVASWPA
jgi:8-oxo-dGTP pyrophosphatase MutT (NUDIX family)